MKTPDPLIVPPDQLNNPSTLRSPLPVISPEPDKLKVVLLSSGD
jgi:hypothetical protein